MELIFDNRKIYKIIEINFIDKNNPRISYSYVTQEYVKIIYLEKILNFHPLPLKIILIEQIQNHHKKKNNIWENLNIRYYCLANNLLNNDVIINFYKKGGLKCKKEYIQK